MNDILDRSQIAINRCSCLQTPSISSWSQVHRIRQPAEARITGTRLDFGRV